MVSIIELLAESSEIRASVYVVRCEVHHRIVVNQPQPYAIQPPDSPEDILVDRRICEEVHG